MEREEFLATASLAHLDLTEDEAASALPAFELMLEYFAAMKAADEDEETSALFAEHDTGSALTGNRLRLDTNNRTNNNPGSNPLNNLANELLNRAPESENRFVVIPNVL